MATAHIRQTTKAYIYSIQFYNQIAQQEPIFIQVDRKSVGILQNCGMFHYWKNQNQNMDIQYINSCINVRINDIWLLLSNARINYTYRCTYYKTVLKMYLRCVATKEHQCPETVNIVTQ